MLKTTRHFFSKRDYSFKWCVNMLQNIQRRSFMKHQNM